MSDWGPFGDFFGGVLNPIISLYSLMLLGFISYLVAKQSTDENHEMNLTLRRMDVYSKYSELRPSIDDFITIIDNNLQGLTLIFQRIQDTNQMHEYYMDSAKEISEAATLVQRYYTFMGGFNVNHSHLFAYNFKNKEFLALISQLKKLNETCALIAIKYRAFGLSMDNDAELTQEIVTHIHELRPAFADYIELNLKFVNSIRKELRIK
jgi:hypothetical protein